MPHILAADLGGTNSRFAHFVLEGGALTLRQAECCPTAELRDTADALAFAARTGLDPARADMLVWAVAGPVLEPLRATPTNAALELDLRPLAARGVRARLINDFAAQAWASLTLPGEEALGILPSGAGPERGGRACTAEATAEAREKAHGGGAAGDAGTADVAEAAGATLSPRGIVGAGTGLGTASLACDAAGRWTALCAEGGHAAFAFRGKDEAVYSEFLCAALRVPYATCEHVLSGQGLARLHRFLVGEDAPVERIAATYLRQDGAGGGHATLRWFGRFYGRMCRHWALNTLCGGGLYVAGGVAGKNPDLLLCADFAEEFYDAPPHMLPFLRRVPVRLMRHAHAGLWGAARAAQEMCAPAGAASDAV